LFFLFPSHPFSEVSIAGDIVLQGTTRKTLIITGKAFNTKSQQ